MLLSPKRFFTTRLADPAAAQSLFLTRVTPLAAIRPLAVGIRSLFAGSPLAGVVVGLGSYALQIGTWLGVALVLPALARQFHTVVDDRQAFVLTTYASTPFWIAGLLYLVPEEPAVLFLWSRLLVGLAALFSLFLVRQGLVAAGVRRKVLMPLLGSVAVAAFLIYGLLFVLLGISSHVALFIIG